MKLTNIRPVPGRMTLTLVSDLKRHLVCLPYSIPNLHKMAAVLGVGRHWFHRDHYDLPIKCRQNIEQLSLIVPTRSIVRLIRMTLPRVTESENLDHEALLYQKFLTQGKTGLHYCPEWDFMAIHDQSPEFDACLCDLPVP